MTHEQARGDVKMKKIMENDATYSRIEQKTPKGERQGALGGSFKDCLEQSYG
jgi:hypothetical protein